MTNNWPIYSQLLSVSKPSVKLDVTQLQTAKYNLVVLLFLVKHLDHAQCLNLDTVVSYLVKKSYRVYSIKGFRYVYTCQISFLFHKRIRHRSPHLNRIYMYEEVPEVYIAHNVTLMNKGNWYKAQVCSLIFLNESHKGASDKKHEETGIIMILIWHCTVSYNCYLQYWPITEQAASAIDILWKIIVSDQLTSVEQLIVSVRIGSDQ